MSVCIFLGPTLEPEAANAILDATYLPPIRQGDILRAMEAHQPEAIGIIDGYFEQTPAVWHKEILWALTHGIAIFGAASMGALRAAELEAFGMVGVGRIFEAYKSGVFAPFDDTDFEDDDEVAVSHGPAELGYPSSVAMVDMRASLAAACEAGVIDTAFRDRVANIGKSIFYKDRQYDLLLDHARIAGLDPTALVRLEAWLSTGKIFQKRVDAEELLSMMGRTEFLSSNAHFHFEHTTVWEAAISGLDSPSQE